MNEVVFERPARSEPARVLKALERWFTTRGYTVSARSGFELHLVGAGHRLSVRADGLNVRLAFAPGSPGVTLPEAAELERRVDTALQEFGAAAPAPAAKAAIASGQRCSLCATPLSGDDRTCPTCGMTQS